MAEAVAAAAAAVFAVAGVVAEAQVALAVVATLAASPPTLPLLRMRVPPLRLAVPLATTRPRSPVRSARFPNRCSMRRTLS